MTVIYHFALKMNFDTTLNYNFYSILLSFKTVHIRMSCSNIVCHVLILYVMYYYYMLCINIVCHVLILHVMH